MGSAELAWVTWGNPSRHTILLIHGAAGCGRIWQPLSQVLADQYHLVAPDLRGHGASPRPGSYRPEELLADIEAFVEARGLQSFTLIGHALGGLLALGYAIRHAERVAALVSVDVNVPLPKRQIEHLRAAGRKLHPVFASWTDAIAYLRKTLSAGASDEILELVANCVLVKAPGGWSFGFDRQILRHYAMLDAAAELERVQCPTLFLRGSESPVMDRSGGIAMLHRVAGARLAQIPRCGHYVFLDNPAATAHEVRLFLVEALRDRAPALIRTQPAIP
ncbi:MAG TPA: alpha/beta hydrolase [Candidatus Kryptonia bacterium]|nr:alpha/beta hydrolase [Candidatus Kryptonia bacterium]